MYIAHIRFYEELNDFLPAAKRKIPFSVAVHETPSVKSIIEAVGVPQAEVDLLLINGVSVDFSEKVRPGDLISVYPVFESFDISGISRIRLHPLREPKFVLDVHLGRLARYLRMLGFDSVYDNRYDDDEIIRISLAERRSVLTRDRRLLMRKVLERGYWVRSGMIREQVAEVMTRFDLQKAVRMFSRCTLCNGLLNPAAEELARLEYTRHHFRPGTRFLRCEECGKIYWNGGHCDRFAGRQG